MKNRDFFYLQYDKINWKNQEKTKINSFINSYIIKNIILRHEGGSVSVFDIGLGIGFFLRMVLESTKEKFGEIKLGGCEPSLVNYKFFAKKQSKSLGKGITFETYRSTFQAVKTSTKFDFLIAIYVFPHFLAEDMELVAQKIYDMLKPSGKFVLVLANEDYLKKKLRVKKDLFIERGTLSYRGKSYKQVLHYSDIPKIGKVIDYNREEKYYEAVFKDRGLRLASKENLEDNGFVCTLSVFEKVARG